MSFFDRRKENERRSDKNRGNDTYKGPEKREGKERRSWKDRRQDSYHQLELSKRKAIYQIIEMLERDVND